jgi:molybdopterin biosynthesis enzyme MoaB
LTSGLVRLPRRFYGDPDLVKELQPNNGTRSLFDDVCPPAELALLAADGRQLGVGVAELLPVEGRDLPVLSRLEPEFLFYRWSENRWYYKAVVGLLPITPGDGRWVLHLPGGRVNPWRNALWQSLGRSYINKEHAMMHRANYSAKLANPARAATAPLGASEEQRQGFIARVIAWGVNTVFELPPGWDVKLIESKGEGYQVFQNEITQSDNEMMVSIAGQVVTTTGGTGFANADVHRLIRGDIIQDVGDGLSHTLNTQVLPVVAYARKGIGAVQNGVTVEYITKAPKDHEAESRTMTGVAAGITQMRTALAPDGKKPEVGEILTRYDIPVTDMTPEDVAKRDAAAEAMQNPDPGSDPAESATISSDAGNEAS